jgi:predicted NUDIX family NTP pyrophosphohydrolase
MSKQSAGLLLYRWRDGTFQVLLVHPGGPFWAKKDAGAWSIPKGEFGPDEDPLTAALREFAEETGTAVAGSFLQLTPLRQPSRKLIHAWAVESDLDVSLVKSNTFAMEWPPRSGITHEFPEIDRASWFTIEGAKQMIIKGQIGFIEELERMLGGSPSSTHAEGAQ